MSFILHVGLRSHPPSGLAASPVGRAHRLGLPEPVRRLRRVQTPRPPIQPRQMLADRRLADAELVGSRRDGAGPDVRPQDLELAPGRPLLSASAGLPLLDQPHLRRRGQGLGRQGDREGATSGAQARGRRDSGRGPRAGGPGSPPRAGACQGRHEPGQRCPRGPVAPTAVDPRRAPKARALPRAAGTRLGRHPATTGAAEVDHTGDGSPSSTPATMTSGPLRRPGSGLMHTTKGSTD